MMDNKKQVPTHRIHTQFSFLIFFFLLTLLCLCPTNLQARPINKRHAEKVVRGWLKRNPEPLGMQVGKQIRQTQVYTDANGETAYYVVYLQPEGFIIVPADDEVEPIVALVARGIYDPSDDNPLGALVSRDVPARITAVREFLKAGRTNRLKGDSNKRQRALLKASSKAQSKWALLQSYDDKIHTVEEGLPEISDVRVAPLIQTKWNQIGIYDYDEGVYYPIFDYYTPGPYYYCGCVATAMAQLMRYHEHPTAGVGTPSFEIYVDESPQTASLRGGDGFGGPYHWSDMVFEPDIDTPEEQRQAIGALCYDAGVAVNMSYTATGSSAFQFKASDALTETFVYNNAVYGYDVDDLTGTGLIQMINPNLDANLPTILGIDSSTTGSSHAVVCDGYGYDNSTLYHHLNMGWRGNYDAWYALPEIGASNEYDIVTGCIYNIFTEGSGEIISGRVTDFAGNPISNVYVMAHICGGETYFAMTNDNGIYVFRNMPSETGFYVTACKTGWHFGTQRATTDVSEKWSNVSGNVWGVDFTGVVSTGSIELEREAYLTPELTTVRVVDADLQGNGTQTVLLKTCSGDVETVTLTEYPDDSGIFTADIPTIENTVSEEDGMIQVIGQEILLAFYEDSNDGTGNPIVRRDTATIANEQTIIYQTDFESGIPPGWTIIDGYSDGITWTSGSPGGRTSPHWSGNFMIIDLENYPFTTKADDQLITPVFDFSMYDRVNLSFSHDFCFDGFETGMVDVCVNEGDWRVLIRYLGSDFAGIQEIDLTPIAAGQSNVQIRWRYYTDMSGLYWGIDDFKIVGLAPQDILPSDFEPDCDVDWDDLAILVEEWLREELSADIAPNGGDGVVDFLDWAIFADGWQITNDISDLAVFFDQWLQTGANYYIADTAPDGGDGVVNMLDFARLAKHWLEGVE